MNNKFSGQEKVVRKTLGAIFEVFRDIKLRGGSEGLKFTQHVMGASNIIDDTVPLCTLCVWSIGAFSEVTCQAV